MYYEFKLFFKEIYSYFVSESAKTPASILIRVIAEKNNQLPESYFREMKGIIGELATNKFKETYVYKMHRLYDTELEVYFK